LGVFLEDDTAVRVSCNFSVEIWFVSELQKAKILAKNDIRDIFFDELPRTTP
jgi:hypothetical protein